MFLSGTLLNVATVLIGTTLGVIAGRRLPARLGESLTTGLGLFVAILAIGMASTVFSDPNHRPGDELAVLAGLLVGVAIGGTLRLHDRLEGLGGWLEERLARGEPAGDLEARSRRRGVRHGQPRLLRRPAHHPGLARQRPPR